MSIINYIGQFLKEQGYEKTLNSLELEYGHPISTSLESLPTNETLKEILNDRINFKNLPVPVEDANFEHWQFPYPRNIKDEFNLGEVIVSVEIVASHKWLLVSTAKQKLFIIDFNGVVINAFEKLIGVVIKRIVSDGEMVYLGGMDGKIYSFAFEGDQLVKKNVLQVQRRLIIDMKLIQVNSKKYLVSLGFEKLIKLIDIDKFEIQSEFETMNYPNCFDVISVKDQIYALIGYNENTLLDLIQLTDGPKRLYKIAISDAEFTTTNFTPRIIQFKPETDNRTTQVAIGTSHEPYMRVIIVDIPSWDQEDVIKRNQIVKNILTMSPQDKFSNPYIHWRLKSDGIWVLGDDGIIRGINLANDDIIELKGHDGKIKYIYSLNQEEEFLVTAGDDRSIKIWH